MPIIDVDALIAAEQVKLDELERQLKDLASGGIDFALAEYRLLADKVASAKKFIEEIETDTV